MLYSFLVLLYYAQTFFFYITQIEFFELHMFIIQENNCLKPTYYYYIRFSLLLYRLRLKLV